MKVVAVHFTPGSEIDAGKWAEIFYRYSSQVAVRENEAVLFEIEGSQNIYSEENIMARVRALLRRHNIKASVACGADAPTALSLAVFQRSRVLLRKGDLPLTALHYYSTPFYRDEDREKIIARKIYLLQKLGIENLAGFLALPIQAIVSHLGAEMLSLYEAVRDSRQLPWPFWHPSEHLVENLTLEERENLAGVGHSPEALVFLLKALIDRLVLRCRGRGRRLVRFGLAFVLEKTSRHEGERTFEWTLTLPHLSAREILNMVREKVAFSLAQKPLGDTGTRIEDLRLEAFETAPNSSAQKDIFNPQKEEQHEAWLSLVSRLTDKLGAERVFMAIPQESYAPERAWKKSLVEEMTEAARSAPLLKLAPRPLRLFKKPIAVGRAWFQNVTVSDVPEVLGSEWWKSAASSLERVYFHVVDKRTHEKFWVFRSGEGFFIHGYF
jgi:hypothetical protein